MHPKEPASDAMTLLRKIEGKSQAATTVPLVDREDASRIADALSRGDISARRMARAMGASFAEMDETFAHHGLEYRIGL